MAENLEIKLKVTGDKSLDVLIAKLNEGRGSLNDLTQAKKLLNAQFKGKTIDSKEWNDYAKALADINVKQSDVRIATKAGHEEYFRSGLQLRQLLLTTERASGAMGSFTNVITNSASTVIHLRQMLIPLGIQMSLVGIGIASVVSLGIGLISFFSDQAKKTKEATEELRKYNKEMNEIRLEIEKIRGVPGADSRIVGDKLGQVAVLQARAAKINAEIEERRQRAELRQGGRGHLVTATEEEAKQLRDIDREILGIEKDLALIDKERLDTLKKQRQERELFLSPLKPFAGEGKLSGKALREAKLSSSMTLLNLPLTPQIDQGLERAREEAAQLAQTLQRGAHQFSSTLINALVQGRDLAQSIGLALLGVLINVGTNYLTGGISSLLGVGGAAGGSGVSVSANRAAGGSSPSIIAQAVVKGGDLLILMKQNSMRVGQTTY